MKVRIVEQETESVKEVTLKQLCLCPFVGAKNREKKAMLVKIHNQFVLIARWGLMDGCVTARYDTLKEMLSSVLDIQWYVFDRAKELYLWLAEGE